MSTTTKNNYVLPTSIRLDPAVAEVVRKLAKQEIRSITGMIAKLILEALEARRELLIPKESPLLER